MTALDERLLQKLAEVPAGSAGTVSVSGDDASNSSSSGWSATVAADAVDTVGSRLREVRVTRTTPLPAPAPVAEQAQAIAKRVTGLLEPLRLVEVDSARDEALLRSQGPAVRGDTKQYYEVLRKGDGTTTLNRYESSGTARREQVPFTLTHEALGKLVRDITA